MSPTGPCPPVPATPLATAGVARTVRRMGIRSRSAPAVVSSALVGCRNDFFAGQGVNALDFFGSRAIIDHSSVLGAAFVAPTAFLTSKRCYRRGRLLLMAAEPTVFIVDDDAAFAESLAALIETMGARSKIFGSAEEFLDQFDPHIAGCLILDVRMQRVSGLTLLEDLASRPLSPPVVIMTGHAEVPTAIRAMRLGAVDFLQKTYSEAELYEALQRALVQDARNRRAYDRREAIERRFSQLTPPERSVLQQVLRGEANKSIAANLGVSRRTVEDRRARIMQKLEVETLADLVRVSLEAGV
jgi:two-component system, LuxR family, response regulator FixJ